MFFLLNLVPIWFSNLNLKVFKIRLGLWFNLLVVSMILCSSYLFDVVSIQCFQILVNLNRKGSFFLSLHLC